MSGQAGLAGYQVRLFASLPDAEPAWRELGAGRSDAQGRFQLPYGLPQGATAEDVVLFVEARQGDVQLAGVIDPDEVGADATVVVNERTTVAVANAFAQFVDDGRVVGNRYGMKNAARMAGNLANPRTGATGVVLASSPNAQETATLATFNTLANAVSACVAKPEACIALREATAPHGVATAGNLLQALANLVHYPAFADAADGDPVFALASQRNTYLPALPAPPNNWLLFLKITGGFYSEQAASNLMNGPGNAVFDEQGYVWISDNYQPQAEREFTCGGQRLLKLTPWGEAAPGSPYFGGGLNGAGYGIALDPKGDIWVSNFGFEDPPCRARPQAAPHNSVSHFLPDGTAVSPERTGYTAGDISWPQGTVSDREGNIWIGNCGNDSVTIYPGGNPNLARNIPLPVPDATPRGPRMKPFGAALDHEGNLWLTNNNTDSLSVVSPTGEVQTIVSPDPARPVFSHPIGNAVDSAGNVWVANSDWLDVPCPDNPNLGPAQNPSVTMVSAETREPVAGSPFTGGGVVLPWGISVDGDDTVWVFNFGVEPPGTRSSGTPTSISRFCGINATRCPPGLTLGDPISPATGYQSDSLERLTAGQIDPSGNIWLMNNWKIRVDPIQNPGANAVVIVIGAAGPLKTPLIGPPVGFESGR